MLAVVAVICSLVGLGALTTIIVVTVQRDRRMEDFRQRQREQMDAEMWAKLDRDEERRKASEQSEGTVGG